MRHMALELTACWFGAVLFASRNLDQVFLRSKEYLYRSVFVYATYVFSMVLYRHIAIRQPHEMNWKNTFSFLFF